MPAHSAGRFRHLCDGIPYNFSFYILLWSSKFYSDRPRRPAAIVRPVTDILAGHHIDDIFGDIGRVVGDPLEILRNRYELERRDNDRSVSHHVSQ